MNYIYTLYYIIFIQAGNDRNALAASPINHYPLPNQTKTPEGPTHYCSTSKTFYLATPQTNPPFQYY